ncbi:TIGR04290 family methyltransferase [Coralloluteibacterium stylophorae]|uniref:TIGR04290 family methyltransferase n=1 Tax=Coralloluteibacterium stylophorae TaxID=1776034 RepID=A0A8J7VTR4_9GAMM|nr:TIGR04290 family methyltransferase [Coralloluteibacterium stylophorae]MBS7456281.1 TIGR04290 family methyltransferase [Coralloluteibacterium stylophorae]
MTTLKTLQSHGTAEGPLAAEIRALGPWFHNIHLPDGSQTAPDHPLGDFPRFKWERLAPHLPQNLGGMRVLDIGCNAGFYSFQLARRGAQVVAMDHDPHYLRQAGWVARQLGLEGRVELRQGDVYSLAPLRGQFDLVLFLGVFYHLRHPLLGLDLAAAASRDYLLFQSLATTGPAGAGETRDPGYLGRDELRRDDWPKLAFVEHELAGDPTNWWVPNPPAMQAMVRSAGFAVRGMPDDDVYLCRRTAAADQAEARLHATLTTLARGTL